MQDVTEIIKKVRRIEIVANRTVNELLAGQYKSVFRGQGIEFNEVREYEPGDDVRLIDWNVTAREGKPFIKRFSEERELSILFLVDVSASGIFGTNRSKWDLTLEIAATLMFSAIKNNDKVGLITFCDQIEKHFVPRKGKANVLRLIRELVACEPVRAETNLDLVLEHVSKTEKRHSVIFLIGDFLIPGFSHSSRRSIPKPALGLLRTFYRGIERSITAMYDRQNEWSRTVHRALSLCSRRHDVIAISTIDPHELEIPNLGFLRLTDAETGEQVELDTGNRNVRDWLRQNLSLRQKQITETLQKAGVDQLKIFTSESTHTNLRRFFRGREKQ
ncbi:MAG: DUF58 domain-containing protein [Planctomycetaceae bacterium]|nr:DUF58 domain-containing protein [Planctomycetaceae bacterium]MCL2305077.1 DUF58 domain-containing protein [Planctomycetaceae bacterium]